MNDVATMDSFAGFENLPDGWGVCPLIDLITSTGIMADGDWVESKDQDPGGDVRLIQLADIGDGCFLDRSKRFLTAKKAAQLRCTFLTAGDVLLARMPEPLGRACIFPGSIKPCVTAVDVCIFRSGHDGVDHHWLMHTINSPAIRSKIESLSKGVTRKRISGGNLKQLRVPLPPLNEQRRIAAKIDELFSQLDAGVANLKRARALLEKYRQAVLKTAVTGELTREWRERSPERPSGGDTLAQIWRFRREVAEQFGRELPKPRSLNPDYLWPVPDSWAWCSIDEAGDVQLGQQRAPQHHEGQHMRPYLRVANVLEDELDLTDIKWMNFDPKDLDKFELCPGDILLNEGQAPALLGRSAIYHGEIEDCCIQKTLLRFRAFPNVLPRFAQIVFLYYMHSGRFRRIARITTNIGHLTRVRFVEMEFPLPPTSEQEEIASRFEAIDTNIKSLQHVLSSRRDGTLKRSILDAAFSGKLVSQDPHDEPASVLLERIRAKRAKHQMKSPHRGRAGRRPTVSAGQLERLP